MKSKLFRSDIVVRKSPIQGYGVFANQDFKPGDVIEECHTVIFDQNDMELNNYLFSFHDKVCGIALGYGSIYNHAVQPDAEHAYDEEHSIMVFTAVKPIKRGQEIFVSYGDNWFSSRNLKIKESYKFKMARLFSPVLFLLRFGVVIGVLGGFMAVARVFL